LRRSLAAGLVLAATVSATAGWASTVVLVRPANPAPTTAEALVRIHGELVSAGFDVEIAAATAGADPRTSLEQTANGGNVDAVVAILGDGKPGSVEVWVIDRVTGKSVVRRVPSQAGSERAAEILAIRAIELLRASLLEIAMFAASEAPAVSKLPSAEVTRFVEHVIEPRRKAHWSLELGASGVVGFDGVGPALLPMIRFGHTVGRYALVRITAAGMGSRSQVQAQSGSAEVAQQFGLVEAALRLRPQQSWRPFFSLGAGARHTTATGQALWPDQGQSAAQWSFLADAGAGLRLSLASRFEIALEVHAQLTQPYPVIRFLGAKAATAGRPDVLPSLTLIAWL
jgi:hypothetical protein